MDFDNQCAWNDRIFESWNPKQKIPEFYNHRTNPEITQSQQKSQDYRIQLVISGLQNQFPGGIRIIQVSEKYTLVFI